MLFSINFMMFSVMIYVMFLSIRTASSSSIEYNGVETKKQEDVIIHHNDMIIHDEPTILRKTTIGKLNLKQKEDEQQGHNDITLFHRTMADDCVFDEADLISAVSKDPRNINICIIIW